MPLLEYAGCKLAIAALNPVIKKVGNLIEGEADQLWDVDAKFNKLKDTYIETITMLERLDTWQIKETTLASLLQDLDGYCYDVEDIVDDIILSLQTKEEDQKPNQHPMRKLVFLSGRLTIPHQVGELQKKLQGIGDAINKLLSAGSISSTPPQDVKNPSDLMDKTTPVSGTSRDQDKQAIIQLINQRSDSCGVSIIGIDGIGKTSLVRAILHDETSIDHYSLVLAASVSGPFKRSEVVQELLQYHFRRSRTENHHQPAVPYEKDIHLQQLLSRSKSLIVLDDLWNVTDEDWEYFKTNFLDLCSGWKIVTTTRNPNVAVVTQSSSYYLKKMTDEECKELIIHKGNLSIPECKILENDLMEIAKKCMGMPVVANKLGLKLSQKRRGDERKNSVIQFKMKKLWDLQEFKEIFPFLSLNQPMLSADLKRCLAYCSLFPREHRFHKEDLIQSWEVEGFIQSQQTRRMSRDKNECFEDMLSRSILQPSECGGQDQLFYKMHEFNHEFAHQLASNTFYRIDRGTPNNILSLSKDIRHISLNGLKERESILKKIKECQGLRTFRLLHLSNPKTHTISYDFFSNLHRLRLLDLSHSSISQISKLKFPSKHLRCLDLSYCKVQRLPKTLCSLRALQVLKLKGSTLLQLPEDLNQLTHLTHLHVDMKNLSHQPSNIRNLTKLEVLDSFCVKKDQGCKIEELRDMELLSEVHIFGLENIKDMDEGKEAMLCEKQYLQKLVLEWDDGLISNHTNVGDVLEGLQPHNHLDDLVVRNYGGLAFPTWLLSPSCQLVSIYFDNCPNCKVIPSLSVLPFLRTVVFRSMHKVVSLDVGFCGKAKKEYPSLEFLEFHDMKVLVDWTGAGDMPCLCALKIIRCPMLVTLPSFEHLGCLMSLEINNCSGLEALPGLPSSLNADFKKLVIMNSDELTKRCKPEGADWHKIEDIECVEIDGVQIPTKSLNQPQKRKEPKKLENICIEPNGDLNTETRSKQPFVEERISKSKGKEKVDEATLSKGVAHVDSWVQTEEPNNSNHDTETPREQPCADIHRMESNGKQRVNEGTSSNQVAHQNNSREQPKDVLTQPNQDPEITTEDQPTSHGIQPNQDLEITTEDQPTSHGIQPNQDPEITTEDQPTSHRIQPNHWQMTKKPGSIRRFFGSMFGCFSQVFEDYKMELQKSSELDVGFEEETLDKQQAEAGANIVWQNFSSIEFINVPCHYDMLSQESSKERAPTITAPKHHPATDVTVLKNPDIPYSFTSEYEERLGVQVLDPAKELEAKKILFVFEEGYEFEKMMIIQLWMALGLLTNEPMEKNGANYFKKLVSEGYIICSDVACSLYKVNTEKLYTELNNNLIEKQNYIILDNGSRIDEDSAQTWHASVVCDEVDASMFKTLAGFNNLRTLLFLGNHGSRLQQLPRDLFLCYDSLVTLALSGAHIKELPSSAVKLVNLRYLDLSWTLIDVLPERIDRFEKLQTLKLAGCTRLRRLPQEIAGLIELRHLHVDVLRQLSSFPKGMGALVNIRTLSAFPVGTKEGLKVNELKHLNNIMGKFCIANMENVQSRDEAKEASLEDKRDIKKLELRWSDDQYEHPRDEDEPILENLRPHSELEEIQILCYPGSRIPDWISDVSFNKLTGVTLFRCVYLTTIPSLWKLPSLVSLELISLNNVATIEECESEVDNVAFPKLKKLEVDEMLNVQTWKEARQGDYPCLVDITIKDCPKLPELSSLPYLSSAKYLEVTGCTTLAFVSDKELSTSLKQLIIEDCPLITERCSNNEGRDWHKIQNIGSVWIDQVAIIQTCEVENAL